MLYLYCNAKPYSDGIYRIKIQSSTFFSCLLPLFCKTEQQKAIHITLNGCFAK